MLKLCVSPLKNAVEARVYMVSLGSLIVTFLPTVRQRPLSLNVIIPHSLTFDFYFPLCETLRVVGRA